MVLMIVYTARRPDDPLLPLTAAPRSGPGARPTTRDASVGGPAVATVTALPAATVHGSRRGRRGRRRHAAPATPARARRPSARRAAPRRAPRGRRARSAPRPARRSAGARRRCAAPAGPRRRALRTRLTTGTGSPDGTVPSSCSPRTSRCSADRVGAADDDDVVGRGEGGQRRRVAARGQGVVAELLVVLEAEAAVDDDELHERRGSASRTRSSAGRPHLGPALGLGHAGEHPQAGDDLGGQARRGRAGPGCPGRRRGRRRRCPGASSSSPRAWATQPP